MESYREIQSQFESVVEYSQQLSGLDFSGLFKQWSLNKDDFIKWFGGLIYTVPEKVSFSLGKREKELKFKDFINQVEDYWHNPGLAEFLDYIPIDDFFNNLLSIDYIYGEKTIKKNTKVIKDFKYFESNQEYLAQIQDCASRLIQEDKITGTLCFSVHPLDYLSVSENAHNWRSCHALDGDYRAGNLQYMADNCTVVCYLRSDEDAILPNFPRDIKWNNKKWRVLLFFSRGGEMVFAGRQYPFMTNDALEIIKTAMDNIPNRVNDRFGRTSFGNWHDEMYTEGPLGDHLNHPYIQIWCDQLKSLDQIIKEPKHVLFFNDLLYSSCYTKPKYLFRNIRSWWKTDLRDQTTPETVFKIGEEIICPCCREHYLDEHSIFVCSACGNPDDDDDDNYYYCDCCGRRIYYDDVCWVGDTPLCEGCYENETEACDRCGTRVYRSELKLDRESGQRLCYSCRNLEEVTMNVASIGETNRNGSNISNYIVDEDILTNTPIANDDIAIQSVEGISAEDLLNAVNHVNDVMQNFSYTAENAGEALQRITQMLRENLNEGEENNGS